MRITPIVVHSVGAACLAAILGMSYVIGIHSRITAQADNALLQRQIETLEESASSQIAQARVMQSQIDRVERAISSGRGLRSPNEQNAVLAEIAQFASDQGLNVDSLSPGASASLEDDPVVGTPIQLRGRGSASAVMRMLDLIHDAMAGVEVRSLSLSANPFIQSDAMVSVEFLWHADRND